MKALFILGKDVIPIDLEFKTIQNIGEKIINILSEKKQYNIQSNVDLINFNYFCNYLKGNFDLSSIKSQNYIDFSLLANEFDNQNLLEYLARPEFEQFRKDPIFTILKSDDVSDKSKYEQYVSLYLDYYLDKYDNEMKKIQFTSLYNIFSNKMRKLANHEKAYQFIKNKSQEDSQFCVLYKTLESSKLTKESFFDSLSNENNNFNFHPLIESSFIIASNDQLAELFANLMKHQNSLYEKINERLDHFDEKYVELSDKIDKISSFNDQANNKIQNISNSINEIKANYMASNGIVSNLQNKVDEVKNKIQKISIQNDQIYYDSIINNPFNGIINKLKNECKRNVFEKVRLTSSDPYDKLDYRQLKNIVDLDNKQNYFHSANIQNAFVSYEFNDIKVRPLYYSIRSRHDFPKGNSNPMNWVIEGSNSGNEWTLLDSQNNVTTLDSPDLFHTFEMKYPSKQFFKYLRIRQTGKSSAGQHYLVISALEFFGEISRVNA